MPDAEGKMTETQLTLDAELLGEDGEAELVEWLVPDHSDVSLDQEIVELSTSKALIQLAAPATGRLTQLAAVGDVVVTGQAIASIAH